jgi:hypothetical protein
VTGAGTRARERFQLAMQSVAVGARLARRSLEWTVTAAIRRDTSVELTLRRGRRSITVSVGVCHSGPVLWEAGLRAVATAPTQHALPGMAA